MTKQTQSPQVRFKQSVLVAATSAAIVLLSACAAPEDKSAQQRQQKEELAQAEQIANANERKQKALRDETRHSDASKTEGLALAFSAITN
jgi:protein involved in sex pheromone biosynthesis